MAGSKPWVQVERLPVIGWRPFRLEVACMASSARRLGTLELARSLADYGVAVGDYVDEMEAQFAQGWMTARMALAEYELRGGGKWGRTPQRQAPAYGVPYAPRALPGCDG